MRVGVGVGVRVRVRGWVRVRTRFRVRVRLGLVRLSVTRRLDHAREGPVVAVVLVELDDLPHGVGPLDHLVRLRVRVRVMVRARVGVNVRARVGVNVRARVGANVRARVGANVRARARARVWPLDHLDGRVEVAALCPQGVRVGVRG